MTHSHALWREQIAIRSMWPKRTVQTITSHASVGRASVESEYGPDLVTVLLSGDRDRGASPSVLVLSRAGFREFGPRSSRIPIAVEISYCGLKLKGLRERRERQILDERPSSRKTVRRAEFNNGHTGRSRCLLALFRVGFYRIRQMTVSCRTVPILRSQIPGVTPHEFARCVLENG